MHLASRLRDTTLGDLLASLHRAGASGVLELVEPSARHAVHLRRGLVQAVESSGRATAGARLGDVVQRRCAVPRTTVERARLSALANGQRLGQSLLRLRALSPSQLDEALRAQLRERLESLYRVADAEVRFHVARPLPAGAAEQEPLAPRDIFHGRPRRAPRTGGTPRTERAPSSPRAEALRTLGLDPAREHAPEALRAAYRARVLALHPDRAPGASAEELARRARMLHAVVVAFRSLG